MSHETIVAKDKSEHAALAAELIGRAIMSAVQERGVARIALSGGSTPSPAYQAVARLALPFDKLKIFWVDERAVPPSNERSNAGAAFKDFGVAIDTGDRPTKRGTFHRMRGEASSLADAAADYERLLRNEFGVASATAFDAMVMGIGDDGHTASLFPGLGVVGRSDRLVIDVGAQADKKLEPRITLTAPVICEARLLLVLAVGAAKRPVIEKALQNGSEEEIPSRLFQRAKGEVVWLVDAAAVPENTSH
jgi:6-phosphogluconolactonase